MKKIINVILLVCASIVFGSCNKFSNGGEITRQRIVEPFQMVEMCDNVDVMLKHCDELNPAGTIFITTGENLMEGIRTEIEEFTTTVLHDDITDTLHFNKLVISNGNSMSYLRPYDYKLEMTVYYDTLFELIFNSNATITTDTLRGYDYWTNFTDDDDTTLITTDSLRPNLLLDIYGGSGDFTILTNCFRLMTQYQHGTSKVTLQGFAERAETYGDYDCHGIIDGKNLEANEYHMVTSHGTNTIIAKAFNQIIALNDNIGYVYYVRYVKPGKVIHWGHYDDTGHWIQADTIDTLYYCPRSVTKKGSYAENICPYQ